MYYSGRLSVSLIAFTLLVHCFHYFASYWGEDCLDYLKSTSSWIREGNGTPLHYSCLENPTDGGAWWATVRGVNKSRTRLSDFTFTFMHWRRKWQATPVFLPWESQGLGSLVGCHLWGCTEPDTTEATWQQQLDGTLTWEHRKTQLKFCSTKCESSFLIPAFNI